MHTLLEPIYTGIYMRTQIITHMNGSTYTQLNTHNYLRITTYTCLHTHKQAQVHWRMPLTALTAWPGTRSANNRSLTHHSLHQPTADRTHSPLTPSANNRSLTHHSLHQPTADRTHSPPTLMTHTMKHLLTLKETLMSINGFPLIHAYAHNSHRLEWEKKLTCSSTRL